MKYCPLCEAKGIQSKLEVIDKIKFKILKCPNCSYILRMPEVDNG